MIFDRRTLRHVASFVVVAYCAVLGAGSAAAAETSAAGTHAWKLLAQASINPATAGRVSVEEERALRQIFDEKIQRLEGEMNNARGTRNTLLTVAVTTAFLGAGVMTGSATIRSAVEDIRVKNPQEEQNREDALQALDALKSIGGGILGAGGLALVGYVVYSGMISSKQTKIDGLRVEQDSRFALRGLTPEYLQNNESVAAVLKEIEAAKRSAGTQRAIQGFFSRIAIGSLLSGGLLYAVGSGGRNIIDEVNINERDAEEVKSRDEARDEAAKIETTGLILAGSGLACAVAAFVFGRRAAGREQTIDDLENSLLRVAERIDFRPKANGFAVMYSYNF